MMQLPGEESRRMKKQSQAKGKISQLQTAKRDCQSAFCSLQERGFDTRPDPLAQRVRFFVCLEECWKSAEVSS